MSVPRKHQGYAVQWFAMAAVLLIFYLLRSSNLWQLLTGSNGTLWTRNLMEDPDQIQRTAWCCC